MRWKGGLLSFFPRFFHPFFFLSVLCLSSFGVFPPFLYLYLSFCLSSLQFSLSGFGGAIVFFLFLLIVNFFPHAPPLIFPLFFHWLLSPSLSLTWFFSFDSSSYFSFHFLLFSSLPFVSFLLSFFFFFPSSFSLISLLNSLYPLSPIPHSLLFPC